MSLKNISDPRGRKPKGLALSRCFLQRKSYRPRRTRVRNDCFARALRKNKIFFLLQVVKLEGIQVAWLVSQFRGVATRALELETFSELAGVRLT